MSKSLIAHKTACACALTALLVLCGAMLPVAAALANPTQLTIMQDDTRLVYRGSPRQRVAYLRQLKALGADVVKVRLSWSYVARGTNKRHKPHFDATDPGAYSAAMWAPFDYLDQEANMLGLRVYMELGGSAPRWGSHGGVKGVNVDQPNANDFAQFVEAAGRRYSGSYLGLPRVSLWSVWNEPNLASWLAPQYRGSIPIGADIYRSLLYAADDGLKRSGHGGDQLLYGELLPYAGISTGNIKIRPLTFLRELACVDSHYHPFTGRAAKQRGCQHFRPLPGTGVAYHPYTLAGGPNVRTANPDDATIANLGRVITTLDALGSRRRLQSPRPLLWLTEFGFRSDPPDPFETPLRRIPEFMGESEWFAFHNSRVVSYSQYPLVDDPSSSTNNFSGFHSGLRFSSGRAKPGVYQAFRTPIYVHWLSSTKVEVFGGARGAPPRTPVTIESAPAHGGHFTVLKSVTLGAHGYFDQYFDLAGARGRRYRFSAAGMTSRVTTPA